MAEQETRTEEQEGAELIAAKDAMITALLAYEKAGSMDTAKATAFQTSVDQFNSAIGLSIAKDGGIDIEEVKEFAIRTATQLSENANLLATTAEKEFEREADASGKNLTALASQAADAFESVIGKLKDAMLKKFSEQHTQKETILPPLPTPPKETAPAQHNGSQKKPSTPSL